MRVLVAGGAGFIGSHLCDRLLGEGHDVIAVDNFATGRAENVAHLRGQDRFRLVTADVTEPLPVGLPPVERVYHLASPASPNAASPRSYMRLPLATAAVNTVGTRRLLDRARRDGARFLFASTSEVYGDPTVHPQPETYRGNVSTTGPRAIYDEAKRFGETLVAAYHREYGLDARIVRIFNSILAHETVLLFDGDEMHLTPIGEYDRQIESEALLRPRHLRVPAFDPATGQVALREVSAFIKHPPARSDAFVIKTRYGRRIHVTGDHSVFRRGRDGRPEAVPVRELNVGDHVALAGRLPMMEKDRTNINLAEEWIRRAPCPTALWDVVLLAPEVGQVIAANRERVLAILMASGRFDGNASPRNGAGCALRKYERTGTLPLAVWDQLRREMPLAWPSGARLRPHGSPKALPNEIAVTDDLLWLLGLFMAEGVVAPYPDNGTHFITLCSHHAALERAAGILRDSCGLDASAVPGNSRRGPAIYLHSKLLCWVVGEVLGFGGLSREKRIPGWVLQLPLPRFKHFLDGYREGDGTHSGANVGKRMNFVTVSCQLAQDLVYALLRFGIVASMGRYESRLGRKTEDIEARMYPFFSITACGLSSYDILTWDEGVTQTLNAGRFGDLVWARVNAVEPTETTPYVYDFSVPGCENFVAGTGVFAHNTYGERMDPEDGRVVVNFVTQALRGEPLTIYGDGTQTRSFCYVSDLVAGLAATMETDGIGGQVFNLGNPDERTIAEFAATIQRLCGVDLPVEHRPLPTDDPTRRCPDIARARAVLGWEPAVGLEEGLRRTIPYFRRELAIGEPVRR